MAVIQNLKNKSGTIVYPITKTNAVYGTTGEKLSETLDNINDSLSTFPKQIKWIKVEKTISNDIDTEVAKIFENTIPKGKYLLQAYVNFSSNTNGDRQISYSRTNYSVKQRSRATSSDYTMLHLTDMILTQNDINDSFALKVRQTSGTDLEITGYVRVVQF